MLCLHYHCANGKGRLWTMPPSTIFKTTCHFCHLPPTGINSNILTLALIYGTVLLLLLTEVMPPVSPMLGDQLGCSDDSQLSQTCQYEETQCPQLVQGSISGIVAEICAFLIIPTGLHKENNLCVCVLQFMFAWRLCSWSRFFSGFHHIYKTTNLDSDKENFNKNLKEDVSAITLCN